MARVRLEAMGLEFEEGGNTIWVQGSCGTILRIKCTGQILVKSCSAPGAHADALVEGDIEFCVPSAIHGGCVYPAGQKCRGSDRCMFPARCIR